MNLDVNNNGAWKTVLRDFDIAKLADVKLAVSRLADIGQAKFRLADGLSALEYCEPGHGWYEPGFRKRR